MATRDTNITAERLAALETELLQAEMAHLSESYGLEMNHLERAHILSQPHALAHMKTHYLMLRCGKRRQDWREILGQICRLLAAVPASIFGLYPTGNPGSCRISAFEPVPFPKDLERYFGPDENTRNPG